MAERVLRGAAASPGLATGRARILAPLPDPSEQVPITQAPAEAERALAALAAAAGELEGLAAQMRATGREAEAAIIETGALMAADPLLERAVGEAVLEHGRSAPAALVAAAGRHADLIAALPDPNLAARADDVRSLARRAARLAAGTGAGEEESAGAPYVLVAEDLGPADVAELGEQAEAIALAAGAVTAHAAIVARSLGIPMAVGLGGGVFDARPGTQLVVDGGTGQAVLDPAPERVADAGRAAEERRVAEARAQSDSELPAVTRDGHLVHVLVNAASGAEMRAGLAAGAEGAGLIRTELAFLDAHAWPTPEEHRRALAPILEHLRGRVATVRVLDLGGDKRPPFLGPDERRGIELLLAHPQALRDQLGAILRAAGAAGAALRILLPLVRGAADVLAVRELLPAAHAALNGDAPPRVELGAMVELPEAARAAGELAAACDFLSIGTNDLTHATLGTDRFHAAEAHAHDPRVLRHIAASADAGRAAGIRVEVCGEAASDPLAAPLLLGLGVDELSVGAARVGAVRAWVRALSLARARECAAAAIAARDAADVAALAEPLRAALSR